MGHMTGDARKRNQRPDAVMVSRAALQRTADTHRALAQQCRDLAQEFDEVAIYLNGVIDGATDV